MKHLLPILFLTIGLSGTAAAGTAPDTLPSPREYQVVAVKGAVAFQQSGKPLQRRDIFKTGAVLTFRGDGSRLVLIDHLQRSFIAKPDSSAKTGYRLEPLQARVSTRPGKILNYLVFRQFLESRRLLAIGDTLTLEISDETFAMNNDSFFYMQYRWTRESEPVNKRLGFSGKLLFFDKKNLFSVDGQPIDPAETSAYALYYYNSRANASTLINSFDLVFCDEPTLQAEIDVIIGNFSPDASKEQLRNAVIQYIENEYGEPVRSDLDLWLKRHWKL